MVTMRYLALRGGEEAAGPAPGTPEFDTMMQGYMRFGEAAADAIVGGEALEGAATATTTRHGDAQPLVTAGPYAETVDTLGAPIALPRQIPAALDGWVSLRPMVEWFDRGVEAGGTTEAPRYVAFIYGKEADGDQPDTPAWDEGMAAHQRFMDAVGDAVQAGGALHPIAPAPPGQGRDGDVIVSDGPFAESAEVVGGFYVLRASDREAAAAVASQIPAEAIELRPIMEVGG